MTLLPQLPINCQEHNGRALPKYAPFQGAILQWQSSFGQCCHCHVALAGVYRLYKNGRVIYVGVTVNLERRIQEHRGYFDRFDFVEVEDAKERRRLELALIREHTPKLNHRDNPIQTRFDGRIVWDRLRAGGTSLTDLCEELWQDYGMTAATFHHLRRQMNTSTQSKTALPVCPFCDHPRKGAIVCEKCGADLVWLIPWGEGGAALPFDWPKTAEVAPTGGGT